ncbi:MAG: Na+/H+ antiporter subunit E [Clostridiales bacterium]|nr:Na+/H+ antiporter subunit E [Clostridiales bacterium]
MRKEASSTQTLVSFSVRSLKRAVGFTIAWWIISEGDPRSWLFGVPFVVLATTASLLLTPERAWRLHPIGTLRFAIYFLHQSVVGGVDVAMRAIRPSMPLEPDIVRYRMRLAPQHARVLFANTVSMLPGTLSAGIDGAHVTIHALDKTLPLLESFIELEERVAHMFGEKLPKETQALGSCELTGGEG